MMESHLDFVQQPWRQT